MNFLKTTCRAALSILAITLLAMTPFAKKEKWTVLFNGKNLNGWDTYLGLQQDSAGKKTGTVPLGLNNDPQQVFTVVKVDGEGVIRVSGVGLGAVTSKAEFENYHLQLQFKWGSWMQRNRKKRDSGLLYHCVGEHGADGGAWMRSQEFQVQEGDCGEYWGCAGGTADIPVSKRTEKEYVFDPAGEVMTFSAKSPQGRHCFKRGDGEKPLGEWNTLDLYCHGDTSVHVVNGKVVMVLYHNRQPDGAGEKPLNRGRIQLQCEGAEVYYKNIRVQALSVLPAAFLK